jgi:hypothetical protein
MTEREGIRILNKDYDLRCISNIELANIMQNQCEIYDMAATEMSTAILEVWASCVRIAEEIVRRKRK